MKVMSNGRVYFSDEKKLRIIQEIETGVITKEQARRKYGIRGKSAILNWMRSFNVASDFEESKFVSISMAEDILPNDPEELKKRIALLEKQLEMEKLKVKTQEAIIDIAEQTLGIPIRKKSNTK